MLKETAFAYYTSLRLHFTKPGYDAFKYHFNTNRKIESVGGQIALYQAVAVRASMVCDDDTDDVLYFIATFRENPKAFITAFNSPEASKRFRVYKEFLNRLNEHYADALFNIHLRHRVHLSQYIRKHDDQPSLMYQDMFASLYDPEIFCMIDKVFRVSEITDDDLLKEELKRVAKFKDVITVDQTTMETTRKVLDKSSALL